MADLRFSHMALNCQDPHAVERWYTKHFGFQRARVVSLGATDLVFIKCGDMYLELFQAEGERQGESPVADGDHAPGWRHLAFQVDDVDAKLAEMGSEARVTLGPLDFSDFIPGWKTAWVADPEGNIVEISQGYTDQPNPPALA